MQLSDMSFQDLARNGGREMANQQNQGTREVEGLVFRMANGVAQLKKMVDALGSPRDTVAHRQKLADTNQKIQELAREIKDKVTALNQEEGTSQNVQAKSRKLLQDFAAALQDYKAVQRVAAEREAASLPKPTPGAPSSSSRAMNGTSSSSHVEGEERIEVVVERQALLQAQQRQADAAMESAIAYNEAVIEERDAGIAEIQRHIGEVNEMFQDLAVLVHDQGQQLLTVDEHIAATAERVVEGSGQLAKAERSQRGARAKCLCLWFIAGVILAVLLIVLLN